jgi:hypothetical protein
MRDGGPSSGANLSLTREAFPVVKSGHCYSCLVAGSAILLVSAIEPCANPPALPASVGTRGRVSPLPDGALDLLPTSIVAP